MSAVAVVVVGLVAYVVAYFVYARFLADRVFRLDASAAVPSCTMRDGLDYVPTNRFVLFGHHFASIAGAAPIIGPAIAVIWGWAPAFLWVVLGAIFMGCVHDFGALVVSVRNKARSIGDIAEDLIGPKATTAYIVIMFFVIVLVLAVFLLAIASLLVRYPEVVFPAASLIAVAMLMGLALYRWGLGLLPVTVVGVVLMVLSIWWGAGHPYPMPESTVFGAADRSWITLLAVYGFVASVLPVWLLLQPRDYLESFKLYAGLLLLIAGIFVAAPAMAAPAFRLDAPGAPPIWPFLFITIACGACSGFHSIVSSGTSSKQLASEKDATFVAYGGMLAESALALCAVVACTAGFASREAWLERYSAWGAKGLGLDAFVDGAAALLAGLGIEQTIGKTFIALVVVAFALTTLDSACRLGRYLLAEFGRRHWMPFLENRYVGSLVTAGLAFVLATRTYHGAPAGKQLWPLFGTTNQLLAALVFASVTIYLVKRKAPHWFVSVPLVLIGVTTFFAMLWNIAKYVREQNWLLAGIGTIIFLAGLSLIVLAVGALARTRRTLTMEPEPAGAGE